MGIVLPVYLAPVILGLPELIQGIVHIAVRILLQICVQQIRLGLFLNHFHGGGHKLTVHLLLVWNHIENQLRPSGSQVFIGLLKQRGKPFQILFTVAIGSLVVRNAVLHFPLQLIEHPSVLSHKHGIGCNLPKHVDVRQFSEGHNGILKGQMVIKVGVILPRIGFKVRCRKIPEIKNRLFLVNPVLVILRVHIILKRYEQESGQYHHPQEHACKYICFYALSHLLPPL